MHTFMTYYVEIEKATSSNIIGLFCIEQFISEILGEI